MLKNTLSADDLRAFGQKIRAILLELQTTESHIMYADADFHELFDALSLTDRDTGYDGSIEPYAQKISDSIKRVTAILGESEQTLDVTHAYLLENAYQRYLAKDYETDTLTEREVKRVSTGIEEVNTIAANISLRAQELEESARTLSAVEPLTQVINERHPQNAKVQRYMSEINDVVDLYMDNMHESTEQLQSSSQRMKAACEEITSQ